MTKDELINLTNQLYHLTSLLPKKEPLRYKIRELADEILADFISQKKFGKKLEVLDSFWEVVRNQSWVKMDLVLNLVQEYSKLKQEITEPTKLIEAKTYRRRTSGESDDMEGRQKRILETLEQKDKIQVWQIKEIFPEITKRTLRRDFEYLLGQGLIRRIGQKNETFYQLA